MELEAGDGVEDCLRRQIDSQIVRQPRLQRAMRGGGHQDGFDDDTGEVDETLDHQAPFGDEEAVRLEPLRIANVAIAPQARIVVALDGRNHGSVNVRRDEATGGNGDCR